MRQPISHEAKANPAADKGFKTPLKTIRGLGSAREGTEHFIRQRLTALANFVLLLALGAVAIALSGRTYPEAVALVASPWVAVPLALAFVSVCIHMRLGVQVIVEDYVQADGARILLLVANTFFALAVLGAALWAVVRIVFADIALPLAA